MHAQLAEGIVPRLPSTQVNALEFMSMHRKVTDLFIAEIQADRHAVEDASRLDGPTCLVQLLSVEHAKSL